jgi:hypothetical protein
LARYIVCLGARRARSQLRSCYGSSWRVRAETVAAPQAPCEEEEGKEAEEEEAEEEEMGEEGGTITPVHTPALCPALAAASCPPSGESRALTLCGAAVAAATAAVAAVVAAVQAEAAAVQAEAAVWGAGKAAVGPTAARGAQAAAAAVRRRSPRRSTRGSSAQAPRPLLLPQGRALEPDLAWLARLTRALLLLLLP